MTAAPALDLSGEYLFRARVALNLAPFWLKRANAIRSCGEAGVQLRCDCGQSHLVPFRCGARSCPVCARIRAAQACERLVNRVQIASESRRIAETWDGKGEARPKSWKLFTGTSRAGPEHERFQPDVLALGVRKVRKAWGRFWRSTSWGKPRRLLVEWDTARGIEIRPTRRARRDTIAIMGLEVAPGGMIHVHAAIYGEYIEQRRLQELWSKALGELARVDVRAMKAKTPGDFRSALREVLKYTTKWAKKPQDREQRAAAIEAAMKRVRRLEMLGAIRSMPGVDALVKQDDNDACNSCGRVDSRVAWVAIWPVERVRENGGFGPVALMLDEHMRRKWRRNPLLESIEAQRTKHGDLADPYEAAADVDTAYVDNDDSLIGEWRNGPIGIA